MSVFKEDATKLLVIIPFDFILFACQKLSRLSSLKTQDQTQKNQYC